MALIKKRELLRGIVNRLNLVGIEFEGGWDNVKKSDTTGHWQHPSGLQVIRDGSVEFPPQSLRTITDPNTGLRRNIPVGPPPPKAIGEIVSPKLTTAQVSAWMLEHYPPHVNATCGLHVHMSFHHKLNYSRLMTPEYMQQLIADLSKWGKAKEIKETRFWDRLNPAHPWTQQHCAHSFLADNQVLLREKSFRSRGTTHSRYTFVNYCQQQHNTVEVRGLTMFDSPEVAVSAVECVLDTTNRFLSKIRQRERNIPIQIKEKPIRYEEIGSVARF